jgi:hypothetical protein
MFIGYRQVINCLDVGRVPQMLDGGDESLSPGVEEMLWLTPARLLAP